MAFTREELQAVREQRHRLGVTSEPRLILLARRNAFGVLDFEEVIVMDLPDPVIPRTRNIQTLAAEFIPAREGD